MLKSRPPFCSLSDCRNLVADLLFPLALLSVAQGALAAHPYAGDWAGEVLVGADLSSVPSVKKSARLRIEPNGKVYFGFSPQPDCLMLGAGELPQSYDTNYSFGLVGKRCQNPVFNETYTGIVGWGGDGIRIAVRANRVNQMNMTAMKLEIIGTLRKVPRSDN